MVSSVHTAALWGIEGYEVTVECASFRRLPAFELVGMPDVAVKEAKNRVRNAIENSRIAFPSMDITVNLAPADRKKEGSVFDLAIAVALLIACKELEVKKGLSLSGCSFFGELALSGETRPIRGILSLCLSAKEAGRKNVFVPYENREEASIVEGITVYGVKSLSELLLFLSGKQELAPTPPSGKTLFAEKREYPDFGDVCGQETAKRAITVAAAGGHNILLIGPPGTGKSMLAKRLPGILPELTFEEALESTRIHSVAGTLNGKLLSQRPFRSPHHSASLPSLIGGGAAPKPGEISLAHHGVLFLDELPEFPKSVTEALRQPLEDGQVTVSRVQASIRYPASFMLVCAMNPCKCGNFGSTRPCTCAPGDIKRYLDRVSGPLLDRVDIQVEMPALTYEEMHDTTKKTADSAAMKAEVEKAVRFGKERRKAYGETAKNNASMSPAEIRETPVEDSAQVLLSAAFERLGLSARAHDRVMKVARTIADMEESEQIRKEHIAEAIGYRSLDRKYWGR